MMNLLLTWDLLISPWPPLFCKDKDQGAAKTKEQRHKESSDCTRPHPDLTYGPTVCPQAWEGLWSEDSPRFSPFLFPRNPSKWSLL